MSSEFSSPTTIRLTEGGRADLAAKVIHASVFLGDGLGYDIQSFDLQDGEPIFIEVKMTNCGAEFPFYVSANEVAFRGKTQTAFVYIESSIS